MHKGPHQTGIQPRGGRGQRVAQHHHDRQHKPNQGWHQTDEQHQKGSASVQLGRQNWAAVAGWLVIALTLAAGAFHHHQNQDHRQKHHRQLRRPTRIPSRKPNAENAAGQGLNAEIGDNAVVIDRFHHRQCCPGSNRRARQRQAHPPKQPPWPTAQSPCNLIGRGGLLAQRAAGQKIGIGIKRRAQHQNRKSACAHSRKPIVARTAPAKCVAQGGLHRAGILQKINQRIGPDIGRHRQRRQQQHMR